MALTLGAMRVAFCIHGLNALSLAGGMQGDFVHELWRNSTFCGRMASIEERWLIPIARLVVVAVIHQKNIPKNKEHVLVNRLFLLL
jgi:hypothetical protein